MQESIWSDYTEFVVNKKLSPVSRNVNSFVDRICEMQFIGLYQVLLTGAIGQLTECIELYTFLNNATLDSDNYGGLSDELGDVLFYMVASYYSLGINVVYEPSSISYEMIKKLSLLNEDEVVLLMIQNFGKYLEIVKKVTFQGKPLSPEIVQELYNILQLCMNYIDYLCKLNPITIYSVIEYNKNKLDKRYKDKFTVDESENRKVP